MKSLKLNNMEEQSLKKREQSAIKGGYGKCQCYCTQKSPSANTTIGVDAAPPYNPPPIDTIGKPIDTIVGPIKKP